MAAADTCVYVCSICSYSYMEHIVSKWDELGVLKRVLEKKLIFIETKVRDALLALDLASCSRTLLL